jgi:hypothetical protein
VRHNYCVDCNECAIAAQCPADAFVRVPADEPYLLPSMKLAEEDGEEEATEAAPRPPERGNQHPAPHPSPLETPGRDEEFPSEGMIDRGSPDRNGGLPQSDGVDPSQPPGLHL